jgi:hypothetical protein
LSSSSRPEPARVARIALTVAGALAVALAVAAPGGAQVRRRERPPRPAEERMPVVMDDSSRQAQGFLEELSRVNGGPDLWANMRGVRYYITYRIPGPEGTTLEEWTEYHMVWTQGRPRVRIDNATDSTVVIVAGDTTWVRRDGRWTRDSLAVAPARAQALDARWLVRVPWNLLSPTLKRRIDSPLERDQPFVIRADYGPGEDRPAGTVARLTFAPPGFALTQVHWYDPQSRNWYLLELAGEQERYGWHWAERRTLHASDAAGTRGPVAWTALVQDMQIEAQMPDQVLAPPVVATAAVAAPADSAAAGAPGKDGP